MATRSKSKSPDAGKANQEAARNVELEASADQQGDALDKLSDYLLDLQERLYTVKSQTRAAHALASFGDEGEEGSDLALILRALADELEAIANGMGNYLPIRLPFGVQS